MVEFDFDAAAEEITDYQTIPAGDYVCRIDEVRRGVARDGSERWSLKWVVDRGAFAGRFAAWDNVTFSERAARRVRMTLTRLGFKATGRIEIVPDQLVGRRAIVSVVAGEWTNPANGERILRNQVPWDGYKEFDDDGALAAVAPAVATDAEVSGGGAVDSAGAGSAGSAAGGRARDRAAGATAESKHSRSAAATARGSEPSMEIPF